MNARDVALAVSSRLYDDTGGGFCADEIRYLATPGGLRHSTPTAFVLAHLVSVAWPIKRMVEDSSPDGDCWFIYLAAGSIPEITEALASVKVVKWLAFERGNHPHLVETRRFLHGQQTKQRSRAQAPGAGPCRTEKDERIPDAVLEASAKGDGGTATGALPGTAGDPDAIPRGR